MHPFSFSLLKLSVNVANYLGAIPYIWLKSEKKFTITTTSRRKFYVGYTYIVLYTIWYLTQIPVIFKSRMVVRYIGMAWYLGLLLVHILEMNIILNHVTHFHGLNGASIYCQYYQRTYMKCRYSGFINGSELPSLLIAFALALFPFILCLHSFYFPSNPTYLVSIFPKYFHTFPLIIPFCILIWGLASSVMSVLIFHVCLLTYYVTPFLWVFHKDLTQTKKVHRTKNATRELENLRIIYRSIQILFAVCNEGFSEMIPYAQYNVSRLTLLASAMLVRHWYDLSVFYKVLAPLTFLISVLVWLIMLRLAGELHESSRKCLNSWKLQNFSGRVNSKELKRFRRSCSPVKIRFGSFYKIRKISVLAYLMGTIRGIFKLLVYL